jgi:hypothetical protein
LQERPSIRRHRLDILGTEVADPDGLAEAPFKELFHYRPPFGEGQGVKELKRKRLAI